MEEEAKTIEQKMGELANDIDKFIRGGHNDEEEVILQKRLSDIQIEMAEENVPNPNDDINNIRAMQQRNEKRLDWYLEQSRKISKLFK